ncbi:MAG: sigma-54-dependent transcriptional regulator [Candidatus Aminicenantia bacterium]
MNFNEYFTDFQDKTIVEIVDLIKNKIGPSDYPVIITGQSGTGKDFFAYLIHFYSKRKDKPFIRIDCPNLLDQLAASELLGHEKGAFTDAREQKTGKLELADEGTVYFDLIDTLPLGLQNKISPVFEKESFTRLGGIEEMDFKARIIASSQSDLMDKIRERKFKPELYYLLNIIGIKLPPLKQRKADILPLADYFLNQAALKLNIPKKTLTREAKKWCLEYSWPGNIRQLKNAIERVCLSISSPKIEKQDFLFLLDGQEDFIKEAGERKLTLKEMENLYISYILKLTRGNKTKAAKLLDISRKTLIEKLKKLAVQHSQIK